jgi:hypothetical protein
MHDELFDPTMMQQGESTTNNLWNSRRNDSPECGNEDLNAERGRRYGCIVCKLELGLSKSAERRRSQKQRWFRKGQKWRTGCEGRISVLKRRHGLNRCRYKGRAGMKRWVELGVISDNLINMGRALAR